jgi:tRNA pseudouridine38-40 synthase
LPPDIRITACQLAAPDFHPQFMAVKKRYAYYIYRRREGAVFYRRYALCNSEPLDIEAMQRACRHIAGQHDFRAFCASGSSVKSYVRNVTACRLNESENTLRLDIEANGFLYNMVRIIMGTLLEVGRKRLQAEQVKEIIASRDRCLAGPTVVPHGLYLLKVSYPFSEEE